MVAITIFGFILLTLITRTIEFVTGILILPQRQTALVAKQASTLDVLCNGRLRLGVGLGWNEVEYEALGMDFHNRGRRIEEQVEVLRKLWQNPLVKYEGDWHTIDDAGLNPLPTQRIIPIWFGGHHENVLRRVAEIGDGWMPGYRNAADAKKSLQRITEFLEAAGRDWSEIGLEPRLNYADGKPDRWQKTMSEWEAIDATHISINTMRAGLNTAEEHIKAIQYFAETIGLPQHPA